MRRRAIPSLFRLCLAAASAALLAARPAAAADPFDPHGYIDTKEEQKRAKATELTGTAIYRINGQRFLKISSPEGAIFLPNVGAAPDVREHLVVCQQHVRMLREVLLVRGGMPVEAAVRQEQPAIIEMIRRCNEGKIRGPTIVEDEPDGAVVEVKPKKESREPAAANPNKP